MPAVPIHTLLFHLRNWRYRQLFDALKRVCAGRVLDIGGGYFHSVARSKGIPFSRWTTVEPLPDQAMAGCDTIAADGCRLPFTHGSFDTVLCIHVLEHVLDPLAMVAEAARAAKPGGRVVFMVPQTAGLHMVPHHYCNFTPYWIREALSRSGLTIVEHRMLGGVWSTIASQMVYFFLKVAGIEGYTSPEFRKSRTAMHYFLLAPMVVVAAALIPLGLILSLGDLREEANNHLVVAEKRVNRDP